MTNYDKFLIKTRGFRAGASGRSMDERLVTNKDYNDSYAEGQKSSKEASKRYAEELGVTNADVRAAILRQ